MAFDKTGTLTRGRLRLVDVALVGASLDEVLARGAALERQSRHPLAEAIVVAANQRAVETLAVSEIRAEPGCGVSGTIAGDAVAVGKQAWFASADWSVPDALAQPLADWERAGHSAVTVGWSGRVFAVLAFNDTLRPEASASVTALHDLGLETMILSGDTPGATKPVAEGAGLQRWHAALSPEEKRRKIRDLKDRGRVVAMVGDGLNDGPALAAADLGIALASGLDLARETADVVLDEDGLEKLPWVLAVAREVRRRVALNFFWAFVYNGLAIALAMAGLLQPLFAAALMAGSSFIVIANSLRIEHLAPEPQEDLSDAASSSNAPSCQPSLFQRIR